MTFFSSSLNWKFYIRGYLYTILALNYPRPVSRGFLNHLKHYNRIHLYVQDFFIGYCEPHFNGADMNRIMICQYSDSGNDIRIIGDRLSEFLQRHGLREEISLQSAASGLSQEISYLSRLHSLRQ